VAAIIRTALAPKPADRFASVVDMAQALADLAPEDTLSFSLLTGLKVGAPPKPNRLP
jgi:hypothetical protein